MTDLKRVPIGGRIERSLFRRAEWFKHNPLKGWAALFATCGLAYYYHHRVYGNIVVSHLSNREYELKPEPVESGKRSGVYSMISLGDLDNRQDAWSLRNLERNYSIMTQDHFRQTDDAKYRWERSKDNDYLRHHARERTK
mmetsp:Transcript_8826/g.11864  ORF Transcript_8826/g.11864 Transcript_8826/m.11864 type:complete len:140 (+) Transcript_8826:78-497(+)